MQFVRAVIMRHPAPSLTLLTFRKILLLGATAGGWWEVRVVVMVWRISVAPRLAITAWNMSIFIILTLALLWVMIESTTTHWIVVVKTESSPSNSYLQPSSSAWNALTAKSFCSLSVMHTVYVSEWTFPSSPGVRCKIFTMRESQCVKQTQHLL